MSSFKPLQQKRLPTSAPGAPTSSLLRPSRPLLPVSASAAESAAPVSQAELERAGRLGHSFARIPLFPPASQGTSEQKAEKVPAIDPESQVAPISASTPSAQLSPEARPTEEYTNSGHTPSFGHSFANIPLFPSVQRKAVLPSPLQEGNQLRSRIQAARSEGHPLDKQVQGRLGQGVGMDLSSVRIHTDSEADNLSRSVNAVAFTTGNNIFFRSGRYNPNSSQGMHLLAHEATHVVQQAAGTVAGVPYGGNVSLNKPGDRFERAAEESAAEITASSALSDKIAPASGSRIGLLSPFTAGITRHPVHKDSGSLPIQCQLEDIGKGQWKETRGGTVFTATSVLPDSIFVEDETGKFYIYNRGTHQYQNITGTPGEYYDPATQRYFNESQGGSYVATDASGSYSLNPDGSYVKNPTQGQTRQSPLYNPSPYSSPSPQPNLPPAPFPTPQPSYSSPYSNPSQQRYQPSQQRRYQPYGRGNQPSVPVQPPQPSYSHPGTYPTVMGTPSVASPTVQSSIPALSPDLRAALYPVGLTRQAPLTSRWTKQSIAMSENTVKNFAKTKGELAKSIAEGHGFTKHATNDIKEYFRQFYPTNPQFDQEFDYYFDQKRYEDLILYTLCNPDSEGILKTGAGYGYYNNYYKLLVVHNVFASDGGTAFYRKDPPEFLQVDLNKTVTLNEILRSQGQRI